MFLKEDLISVIVPVFNVEKYLRKCIESIITQTYVNLEILLIDDGSTDGCPSICEEYAGKDKRISVIHNKNGGLSDARNAGLDIAAGKYIFFVDSDDYILNNMIEKLYCALLENNADMSLCDYIRIDEEGGEVNVISPIREEVLTREQALEKIVGKHYGYYTYVWNKLYKREIFNDIRFPYGRLCEDSFVVHLIFGKCSRIACIPDRLYVYLQRPNSIMGRFRADHMQGKCLIDYEYFTERMHYLESMGLPVHAAESYCKSVEFYYKVYKMADGNPDKTIREKLTSIKKEVRNNYRIAKYLNLKQRIKLLAICYFPGMYSIYIFIRNFI